MVGLVPILLRNAPMRLAKVGFKVSPRSTISNRTGDIDAAEQALLHSTGKPLTPHPSRNT
jgi:hypothetical protein